jgi:3-oxoacyl-[acyl-carrier-protein] synthase II
MKNIYIVDYRVHDSLGNNVSSNYENMPLSKGPQTITRYNVADHPYILSTKGFQADYMENGYLSYKTAVNITNEYLEAYDNDIFKDSVVSVGSFAINSAIREDFYKSMEDHKNRYSPSRLFSNNHDLLSALISGKTKSENMNASVNAACSSSMYNLHFASMLIQTGQTGSALVGAIDHSLHPTLQYYWQCSSALSNHNGGTSKPFDKNRDGFLQGEGGTIWFICDEETLVKYNLKPKARLRSIASGAKLTSMTAHDRTCENQLKIINQALKQANLTPKDIAFFNAHATSTPVGDDIELDVFQRAFEGIDIPIVGFKGYIGHTMSACGLIEAAYGIEAVKNGYLQPNFSLDNPLSDDPRLITKKTNLKGKIFMKASFGFGGRTSIAIIESLEG